MELIFNELSAFPLPTNLELGEKRISELLQIYKTGVGFGFDRIRFHGRSDEVKIAENYTIHNWIQQTKNFTMKNLLLSIYKKPFIEDSDQDEVDTFIQNKYNYRFEDGEEKECLGLASAFIYKTLSIGFSDISEWQKTEIKIEVTNDTTHNSEIVYNVYKQKNFTLQTILEQIIFVKRRVLKSIPEFWKRKEELFPSLVFCESVKKQIEFFSANDDRFKLILNKLDRLNSFTNSWIDGEFDSKQIGLDLSPDTKHRKESSIDKRTFDCPGLGYKVFDFHIKWSFGRQAFRLYFYPDKNSRRVFIGYIGDKSGIGY